jgi:hypothetical protein
MFGELNTWVDKVKTMVLRQKKYVYVGYQDKVFSRSASLDKREVLPRC